MASNMCHQIDGDCPALIVVQWLAGIRIYMDQGRTPIAPEAGKGDPEEAIGGGQFRSFPDRGLSTPICWGKDKICRCQRCKRHALPAELLPRKIALVLSDLNP